LATIRLLADSFAILPIGQALSTDGVWHVVAWGSQMFAGAVRIALPAATSLLVANIAFGVMSRAAPTLNLFAVGLPAGLLIGFLLLLLNIGHLSALIAELLQTTLNGIGAMLRA
jgi:flagellar biosynthetic protein FliR